MSWLNESEIDALLPLLRQRAPTLYPFAKYLSDWRDETNARSDGWPYYAGGTRCASMLQEHLTRARAVLAHGDRRPLPTVAELRKALAPIKARATVLKWDAPTLTA